MSEYLYGIEKSHRSVGQSMQALRDYQCQMGAHLETDIPVSFGNDAQALMAADQTTALYDRSHWGRIRVFDRDRLTFLHNQSTNDLKRLQPGQGCETVILTSTARTIDLVSVFATDEEVWLLTAPNRREQMLSWLDRYIFFGDKVQLEDKTDSTVCFSLIGPSSSNLLMKLGIPELPQELDAHFLGAIADIQVRVTNGSGLSTPGYTLIADQANGLSLWKTLTEAEAVPLGEKAWEQLRICQGRPMPGTELTEDYNPLEAGLWQMVSFNKGCYIGQETIARLNTYNGVKQKLWGLMLDGESKPGTPIVLEDQKIGVLTSVVETPEGFFGLGYIKTKAGGNDLKVRVGDGNATVVNVPFLCHSLEPLA
jgi:tRNA-modifying protein YgfZ